jgi:hypothetical protein
MTGISPLRRALGGQPPPAKRDNEFSPPDELPCDPARGHCNRGDHITQPLWALRISARL